MIATEIDDKYLSAYNEITSMLEGKQQMSIKRAVFLSEWAYLGGKLDYEKDFCQEINRVTKYIHSFISANHLERFKTAKLMALCEFFFRPWSGNNYKPYTYDFSSDLSNDDWLHQFVSRTLKSHRGRCHSLPWTFKLFAESLGAKAYIAHGPGHCFIMYKDEDELFPEEWINVELTTHQYQPTFWIKEYFAISDSAISKGTYLTPLSDKQTVASQLSDLAFGYYEKFHIYNQFTLNCVQTSLKYYPNNPNAIIIKMKSAESILLNYLNRRSGKKDEYTDYLFLLIKEAEGQLQSTYMTIPSEELQRKWESGNGYFKLH
ncbi:MAG: hypothetical protein ACI307_04505 [Sodaliphilus sp.]